MLSITRNLLSLRSVIGVQRVQSISSTSKLLDIYKIQSSEDFDEKVKNSKTPVIVDFFAT